MMAGVPVLPLSIASSTRKSNNTWTVDETVAGFSGFLRTIKKFSLVIALLPWFTLNKPVQNNNVPAVKNVQKFPQVLL